MAAVRGPRSRGSRRRPVVEAAQASADRVGWVAVARSKRDGAGRKSVWTIPRPACSCLEDPLQPASDKVQRTGESGLSSRRRERPGSEARSVNKAPAPVHIEQIVADRKPCYHCPIFRRQNQTEALNGGFRRPVGRVLPCRRAVGSAFSA